MGFAAGPAHLIAQQVTTVAPPPGGGGAHGERDEKAAAGSVSEPNGPSPYPDAILVPNDEGMPISIGSREPETISGNRYIADGDAFVTYRDRKLQADHMEYDADTGEVTLTGHILVTGGENDERIQASHGTFNIKTQTGRFYDVSGSVGLRPRSGADGQTPGADRMVYANGNPFLFTGKMVVKTGPREYVIYQGTVTSCQLPHPDWLLSAGQFDLSETKAHATNSIFHLAGIPLLWLPYATHPIDAGDRQTGVLIPEIGFNSSSKGDTVGEQLYWAINRSTDLTVGTIYYSARGWEQTASFRYRGLGQDMAKARYSGLQDRGYYPGGTYVNQSGTDIVFSARRDLIGEDIADSFPTQHPSIQARAVADLEYLSSFPYREAFSTNFNQAVSSDVVSTVYGTREWDGMAASLEGDRYQGEKRVPTKVPLQAEEQVHIFHAPSLEFTTADHGFGAKGLEWNIDSSVSALKRTQPTFETSGMVERVDVHPQIAYPFGFDGWRVRPSIAGRETFYSRSRFPAVAGAGGPPIENTAMLNRSDVELQMDLRPPILERTYDSGFAKKLFHQSVKHTLEPQLAYRYVTGIGDFSNVLRFDTVDVASNTDELEYGLTQRLFLHGRNDEPCKAPRGTADATEILNSAGQDADGTEDPGIAAGGGSASEPVCGNREWISWRLAQKVFFNDNFGGAVSNGPRSILDTTLNFSGIAFLTGPRNISPLISRLRVRTSEKTDIEWDFDFDTCSARVSPISRAGIQPCQKKFTANNVYVDAHQGNLFAGASYAGLSAPARSYQEGVLSSVADFNQMRVLFGFGNPTKAGFSAEANAGIDINLGTVQYGEILTSYNWNCCGISLEYRKYELGSARNDNGYKFNFTLANIGSAGNIRRADQVF